MDFDFCGARSVKCGVSPGKRRSETQSVNIDTEVKIEITKIDAGRNFADNADIIAFISAILRVIARASEKDLTPKRNSRSRP